MAILDNGAYVTSAKLNEQAAALRSEMAGMLAVQVLYGTGAWGSWHVVKVGPFMYVLANGIATGGDSWASTRCPYAIPAQMRPKSDIYAAAATENGGSSSSMLKVAADGSIYVANQGGSGSTSRRYGHIVYPICG